MNLDKSNFQRKNFQIMDFCKKYATVTDSFAPSRKAESGVTHLFD